MFQNQQNSKSNTVENANRGSVSSGYGNWILIKSEKKAEVEVF